MQVTKRLMEIPPNQILWGGLVAAVAFWWVDSMLDATFFSQNDLLDSLWPQGMELYMRLLVSLQMIAFGWLVSKYVENNNALNRYLASDLIEENLKYQSLYEKVPVAILTLNTEARIVECNPATEMQFGWQRYELLGADFYAVFSSGDRPSGDPVEALLDPNSIYGSTRCKTKEGKSLRCSWTHLPIMDGGRLLSVMSIAHAAAAPGETASLQ